MKIFCYGLVLCLLCVIMACRVQERKPPVLLKKCGSVVDMRVNSAAFNTPDSILMIFDDGTVLNLFYHSSKDLPMLRKLVCIEYYCSGSDWKFTYTNSETIKK